MHRVTRHARRSGVAWGLALLCAAVTGTAAAQNVRFETIVRAHEVETLLAVGDDLYGGLDDGGVFIWDTAAPAAPRRWTRDDGLSAHDITGLAWSGRHLWVATGSGGLTRVDPTVNPPAFRQFTSNIGSLAITCVTGTVQGDNEIVYYGLAEGGVGVIIDGFPGAVYTTNPYGLIDNRVHALTIFRGQLWVGTEAGISRFANNVFTDQVTGLHDLTVPTLYASGDSLLLAGTLQGVARWDPDTQTWSRVGTLGGRVEHLRVDASGIWALRPSEPADVRLQLWDGASWTAVPLPTGDCRALEVTDRVWVAGRIQAPGMYSQIARAFLAGRSGGDWESWTYDSSLVPDVGAVVLGPTGTAWLGSYRGWAVSARTGDDWFQIYQQASAANDSSGLIEFGGNIFTMLARTERETWIAQRDKGLIRLVRGAGGAPDVYEYITTANSGLGAAQFTRIVEHPDGPLLFLTENGGVSILLDPGQWRDAAQWVQLPTGLPGLGGVSVRDALFSARDVAWFAVTDIGLVRWDLNGPADPGATLTWRDTADDVWSAPLDDLGATITFMAADARALAVTAEGNLWAGGDGGLVLLRDPGSAGAVDVLAHYEAKSSSFADGLLSGNITDLLLDGNGDLWVGTEVGLDRIRTRGTDTTIDAYTDLAGFFTFGLGVLYSDGIISNVAGGGIRNLARDAAGRELLIGSTLGATIARIAPAGEVRSDPLDPLYIYPNPFDLGESGAMLKLGGITADVTFVGGLPQGGADVAIYNLEGQLVFRHDNVAADDGFWDGRNFLGRLVTPGLYVVRVQLAGQHTVKSLAVLR